MRLLLILFQNPPPLPNILWVKSNCRKSPTGFDILQLSATSGCCATLPLQLGHFPKIRYAIEEFVGKTRILKSLHLFSVMFVYRSRSPGFAGLALRTRPAGSQMLPHRAQRGIGLRVTRVSTGCNHHHHHHHNHHHHHQVLL
jgi:hypothetical protein